MLPCRRPVDLFIKLVQPEMLFAQAFWALSAHSTASSTGGYISSAAADSASNTQGHHGSASDLTASHQAEGPLSSRRWLETTVRDRASGLNVLIQSQDII